MDRQGYAMNVGEVCSREVYIVRKSEALSKAVREMQQRHVGAIVVVEPQGNLMRPIGIVTDRDIVFASGPDRVNLSASVSHVMSAFPLTLREDGDIFEAIEAMSNARVRRAPVVGADGDLVGILSVDDLLPVLAEGLMGLAKLMGEQAKREKSA